MGKPKFYLSVETDDDTGEVLAAYLRVREGEVADTVELADGRANADYDSEGNLLGVELLAPCDITVLDSIAKEEDEPVRRFFRSSPPRSLVLTS
jgi:uncharacterized protein YuzE